MKVAVFSAKNYDREFLAAANNSRHELRFFDLHLNEETVGLAARFHAVCVFVNDHVDGAVVAKLAALGVRLIALRCAGYNNVDLIATKEHAITVVRVPGYSPLQQCWFVADRRPAIGAQEMTNLCQARTG